MRPTALRSAPYRLVLAGASALALAVGWFSLSIPSGAHLGPERERLGTRPESASQAPIPTSPAASSEGVDRRGAAQPGAHPSSRSSVGRERARGLEVFVRAESGLGIGGAEVSLEWAGQLLEETANALGVARFPALDWERGEPLEMSVLAAGYASRHNTWLAADVVEVPLRAEGAIRVRVLDEEGVTVPGVEVHAQPRGRGPGVSATTDAGGVCRLAPLPRGERLPVRLREPGFVEEWQQVLVRELEWEGTVDLRLRRGIAFRGVVLDERSGLGIAGALVRPARGAGAEVRADATGTFEGRALLQGEQELELEVRAPGYCGELWTVARERTRDARIELMPTAVLEGSVSPLPPGQRAIVTLVENELWREWGARPEWARAAEAWRERSGAGALSNRERLSVATTDAGAFRIRGITPWTPIRYVAVQTDAWGRQIFALPEVLEPGEVRTMELELEPRGTIRGRVLLNGRVVKGAVSWHDEEGAVRGRADFDEEGAFVLAGVATGLVGLRPHVGEVLALDGAWAASLERSVFVSESGVSVLDWTLEVEEALLRGIVMDSQGVGVKGCTVAIAQAESGIELRVITNLLGEFAVSAPLGAGEFVARVARNGRSWEETLSVEGGPTVIRIEEPAAVRILVQAERLAVGSLALYVRAADGGQAWHRSLAYEEFAEQGVQGLALELDPTRPWDLRLEHSQGGALGEARGLQAVPGALTVVDFRP